MRPLPHLQEINVQIKDTIQTWAMVISPSVPTITIIISETTILEITILETIILEVPATIALPVVSHLLPVTDPEVVLPLDTAPGVQPGVGVRPLGTALGAQPHITHQEIPEITDLLNPHWEIF